MYTLIDSKEDLAFLNEELMSKSFVAVDTEFRRTKKDNMRLALLQINDGEEIYLIDTVSITNPKDDINFLFSESVLKILHSCKEDLEAIYSWTNYKMVNIFDTQLAHSFFNDDYSISYQSLVEKYLGISLEKSETRSNWIKRPLSEAQLKYASLDVEYLIHLYHEQKIELLRSNKLRWLNEEVERLIQQTFNPSLIFDDLNRTLTRGEEQKLLVQFNNVVQEIAEKEEINSTLFFSKKAQKDFLRLALIEGLDIALSKLTNWRSSLIKKDLSSILP